jgi:AcrR family transcriptional regulator
MNQRVSQLDRTRATIVEAASELIFGTTNPEEITMQAIADAAGVSHRTLYRHFPGRSELINEVGSSFDSQLEASAGIEGPEDFDGWIDEVERTMSFGATHRELLRRTLVVAVATGEFRTDRDESYWRMFRARFPHLPEAEVREDFVAIRHLLGAINVILIGERFEMSPEQLTSSVGRAVRALVADIDERNQRALEVAL